MNGQKPREDAFYDFKDRKTLTGEALNQLNYRFFAVSKRGIEQEKIPWKIK